MRKGNYIGGSTIISKKSKWFSREKQPKQGSVSTNTLTPDEQLERKRLKEERRVEAAIAAIEKGRQKDRERAERSAAAKVNALNKEKVARERGLKRLERLRNDPKAQAKADQQRRKQDAKMNNVIVETKKPKITKN